MTPAAWRALAHKHPRRVVYPEFNPDRPQPPWVPVPDNRTWWQRTQPRPTQLTTVQQGWPSDPVPALPPSGLGIVPDPGRQAQLPYDPKDSAYMRRLENDLPPAPRFSPYGW